MKSVLTCVTVFLLVAVLEDRSIGAKAAAVGGLVSLAGPAVLDEWGTRFISLGASVPENALRTQIRTPSHNWRCSMP